MSLCLSLPLSRTLSVSLPKRSSSTATASEPVGGRASVRPSVRVRPLPSRCSHVSSVSTSFCSRSLSSAHPKRTGTGTGKEGSFSQLSERCSGQLRLRYNGLR